MKTTGETDRTWTHEIHHLSQDCYYTLEEPNGLWQIWVQVNMNDEIITSAGVNFDESRSWKKAVHKLFRFLNKIPDTT